MQHVVRELTVVRESAHDQDFDEFSLFQTLFITLQTMVAALPVRLLSSVHKNQATNS